MSRYAIEDPFQGTLRLSILCDGVRRDVLGDENTRNSAFTLEDEKDEDEEDDDNDDDNDIQQQAANGEEGATSASKTASNVEDAYQ